MCDNCNGLGFVLISGSNDTAAVCTHCKLGAMRKIAELEREVYELQEKTNKVAAEANELRRRFNV